MPAKGIRIDGSFNCAIRTTSTIITASGTDPAQRVPTRAMPGRRSLRIMNNGRPGSSPRADVQLVVGDASVTFVPVLDGFGLELDEFLELPFDDSVIVFAKISTAAGAESADLRTVELR